MEFTADKGVVAISSCSGTARFHRLITRYLATTPGRRSRAICRRRPVKAASSSVAHYLNDLADCRGDHAGFVERNMMAAFRGNDLLADTGKRHQCSLNLSMVFFP